jgi:[acyl-carrier-protein] S-malonyltransferase
MEDHLITKPALIFPGSGTHAVGMGQDWSEHPVAREIFGQANEALGFDLSRLMFKGPVEELGLARNAHPAIVVNSIAVARVLEHSSGVPLAESALFVAGHSLGEFSALHIAGSLDFAETLRTLRDRGQAMQELSVGGSAMTALMSKDMSVEIAFGIAKAASTLDEPCFVSSDNAQGQIVLNGHPEALGRVLTLAAKQEIIARPINVDIPAHSPLMESAVETLRASLKNVAFINPSISWVSNATARVVSDAAKIPGLLVQQMTSPVRWRESITFMARHSPSFIECGGTVLGSMVRRTAKHAKAISLNTPLSLENALPQLSLNGGRTAAYCPGTRYG